jgi:hypothetical protein
MPPFIQWVFLLFGAWLIYLCITSLLEKKKNLALARLASGWPTVTGRIVSARIVEGRSIDSTRREVRSYRPEVEYAYTVGGREYKSTRQAFGKILWYSSSEADAFRESHAADAAVTVYHDPAKPEEAVLDPNPEHATKLVVADFAMLGIGLVLSGVAMSAMLSK